ncbi:hypothetical protein HDU76_007220, partial [Blyttiomyces sp. JEL0837]
MFGQWEPNQCEWGMGEEIGPYQELASFYPSIPAPSSHDEFNKWQVDMFNFFQYHKDKPHQRHHCLQVCPQCRQNTLDIPTSPKPANPFLRTSNANVKCTNKSCKFNITIREFLRILGQIHKFKLCAKPALLLYDRIRAAVQSSSIPAKQLTSPTGSGSKVASGSSPVTTSSSPPPAPPSTQPHIITNTTSTPVNIPTSPAKLTTPSSTSPPATVQRRKLDQLSPLPSIESTAKKTDSKSSPSWTSKVNQEMGLADSGSALRTTTTSPSPSSVMESEMEVDQRIADLQQQHKEMGVRLLEL